MSFTRIYFPFAAGYLLSYLYRMVNAVISPDLTRELGLSPGALGFLTGAYFVAFAAVQIPAGMLLDRFGPRRVEPVLLAIGGTGALLFASAHDLSGLVIGRALIGVGSAVCLMAPLKAIATWYPGPKQASLSGWMMVAGSVGALLATAPLQAALGVTTWRVIFMGFAGVTYAVAIAIFLRVPDIAKHPQTVGLAAQWRGVCSVLALRRFWWIVPVASCGMGSFMAVQGLWSVPWLIEVEGWTRPAAAGCLLLVGVLMAVGYFSVGLFSTRLARRGIRARHIFAAGFGVMGLAFVAILLRVPGVLLWWGLYGLGAVVNILAFTVLNDGIAAELSGRANTAANLVMFSTSFAFQWGIGVVVDVAKDSFGQDTAGGLRIAFALVLVIYAASYAWFLYGWNRHARVHDAPVAAA